MIKTPFYYYDLSLLRQTLDALKDATADLNYYVHYALKANSNIKILEQIRGYGFGVDCVSGNEVRRAIQVGFQPRDIVLAGVGKTDEEISLAISNGIHSINCESIEEFQVISDIASKLNLNVNIALRINPNIDAKTHRNITTGTLKNKFGIPHTDLWLAIEVLKKFPNLLLKGLHFHIGSQITDMAPYIKLCAEVNEIQSFLSTKDISVEHLNMGGGLGIDYKEPQKHLVPDFKQYFHVFHKNLKPLKDQKVHFELGRSIVGQSGNVIAKVLFVKNGSGLKFAILDAGMTELIRPALYESIHRIENLTSTEPQEQYEVVGPICESTDTFGLMELPQTQRGDIIRIWSAGAYGQVLSSNYNLRDTPGIVYSDETKLEDLLGKTG